jgi:Erythronolide synthase docking domain
MTDTDRIAQREAELAEVREYLRQALAENGELKRRLAVQ